MSLTACCSFILRYLLALVAIAFYTLIERKFLGYFQIRKGPNKPGLIGLPVPFADAIKLFAKEQMKPITANKIPFTIAPVIGLTLGLLLWIVYPHSYQSIFLTFGILFFLCVSSLNVYTTFAAGWSSNSKYALLGSLRGVAQTISYEVSISLILIRALILIKSLDMIKLSSSLSPLITIIPLIFLLWFITNLAETNRTPFDFAEGESELVSGFNVEYRRGLFALIFIAEYTRILAICIITSRVWIIGWSSITYNFILPLSTLILSSIFIWIRATIPRMRYDHLIALTWKRFLPITLGAILLLYPLTFIIWHCAGWTDNSDVVNYGITTLCLAGELP